MNILRVCYEYPPPWDGLVPGPYEISLAQVKRGHKIIFIAGGKKGNVYIVQEGMEVSRIGISLPSFLFGLFFYYDIKLVLQIRKILKTKKIDVQHFHGNTALWFNLLRLFGFIRKIPYVFHVHSSGIKYFQSFWIKTNLIGKIKGLFIWPLMILQDFLTVKAADAIIVVSQKDKDIFLKSYKCPSDKIFVVENGVNMDRFMPIKKTNLTTLNLIFVAIIQARKNVEKILGVVKVLSEMGESPVLTIVGRGNKQYISKLRSLSIDLKIEDKILWKGYIPYPELPNVYKENDIFLLLSHSEGLPKVILEAISCGLQVISSKSFYVDGFLKDIVEWVDVDDNIQSIANHVIKARNKKIDISRFRKEYSWTSKVEEIDKIYEKIKRKNLYL